MTITHQARHSIKSHASSQMHLISCRETGHSNEELVSLASLQSHVSAGYTDTHTSSSGGATPPSTTDSTQYQYTALTPAVVHHHSTSYITTALHPQMQHLTSIAHPLLMQRFQVPSPYPYARHNDYQPITITAYDTASRQPQLPPQAPSTAPTIDASQSGFHTTNVLYYAPQHQPYDPATIGSGRQAQEHELRGVGTQFYGHEHYSGRGGQ